jgi:site-specific DNA-methyltransferase (adenine-specific)
MINKIHLGDSVELMKKIQDNSIHLTVTSPPYDLMRTYNNKIKDDVNFDTYYSFPFIPIVKELYRITVDGGIVVWVVNDQVKDGGETGTSFRMALKFQELGFKIYDTMIYHKNGSAFPESGRYNQVFEYMFVFLKGDKPRVVNLLKDKPNKWAGLSTFGKRSSRTKDGDIKQANSFIVSDYGYRYNVWYINNGAGYTTKDKFAYAHPAMFPESLAEDHILSWSNEGDTVLDPMCGAGTVTKMAKMNNRNFIGIDINQEYVDISNKRIEVTPYTKENPNEKLKFLISRETILSKRKRKNKKEIFQESIDKKLDRIT